MSCMTSSSKLKQKRLEIFHFIWNECRISVILMLIILQKNLTFRQILIFVMTLYAEKKILKKYFYKSICKEIALLYLTLIFTKDIHRENYSIYEHNHFTVLLPSSLTMIRVQMGYQVTSKFGISSATLNCMIIMKEQESFYLVQVNMGCQKYLCTETGN